MLWASSKYCGIRLKALVGEGWEQCPGLGPPFARGVGELHKNNLDKTGSHIIGFCLYRCGDSATHNALWPCKKRRVLSGI